MPASRRASFLVCLILAAATLAVYAPVRNHEFVNFDDDRYVTQNSLVQRGLAWEGIGEIFKRPALGFWHPLTLLSHMLDCQLFGLSSGAHHLTNLFFHILNTLLLFLFLKSATGSIWRSAFVAALFALHPLHVESVAWISERKDVLSAFFWTLALFLYVRYARAPKASAYALVMVSFILGLISKTMVVTLPFALLLLDFWPLGRINPVSIPAGKDLFDPRRFAQLFLDKVPMIALSAAASIVAVCAQSEAKSIIPFEEVGLLPRLGNAILSYCLYLVKMFWPVGLSVHYPFTAALPSWKIGVAFLLLAVLTAISLHQIHRRPFFLVGWMWFLGTLVPVNGLIQVGTMAMADRYTYIPLVGLFIAIAWGIPGTLTGRHRARLLLGSSAIAVLILLGVITRSQVAHWKDSISLFEHALQISPNDPVSHNNLGAALMDKGVLDRAREHFEEVLRIYPNSCDPLANIGNILCREGKEEEAIAYYEAALRIRPDAALIHNNLGVALASFNRFPEAGSHYLESLRLKPDFAEAMRNLGRACLAMGMLDRAIEQFQKAVETYPLNHLYRTELGNALAQKGLNEEAERSYEEAIRLNPKKASAAFNGLATLCAGRGDFRKAVELRKRAIAIGPEDSEAHYRLAVESYFLRDYAAADEHCKRAMALGFKQVEPEFLKRMQAAKPR